MTRYRQLCQSREALRVVATGREWCKFKDWKGVVVLIQTGRGGGVSSKYRGVVDLIQRLEGAEVLFQMTNMLMVAFLFGRLLMMLL